LAGQLRAGSAPERATVAAAQIVDPAPEAAPSIPAPAVAAAAPPEAQPPAKAPAKAAAAKSPTQRPAAAPRAATESAPLYAVLVGVDHARGSSPLQGAVHDAQKLHDALVQYGMPEDKIAMFTEGAAEHDAVLRAVSRLALAPESQPVVFSYSGHGRKPGGQGGVAMANGQSILASELARAMAPIRSPMWATFLQCYAASFDVPGIAGPNRVITFASDANSYAWEANGSSDLGYFMVEDGMLGGRASRSVEAAYEYASAQLRESDSPTHPLIDDRFPGSLVLGSPIPSPSA
jgi:hypothetical protein